MTQHKHYDVAIVGAGINGAGIARDAALRGLSVIIFDKNDVCSGTSAVSSRLIHGGLRYLEYGEIPLVYESLHERRILQRIAPHLVAPIRITIPIFDGARRGSLLIRLGMIAYDLLSFRKSIPGHDMLSHDEIVAAENGLRRDGLKGAARYFDAQVTFSERLVIENLLAAISAGAEVKNYAEVTSIECEGGRVSAIQYVDSANVSKQVNVSSVVNAAGPWVDDVLKATKRAARRYVGGTKGSHIVVGDFSGAPKDAFYVEAATDGRPFFIIPWNGQYLIGTTDIRYEESLDHIRASDAEIEYLISETNRVFPDAQLHREAVHYAYAGVRPLPHREKGPESAITRKHIIKKNTNIAKGLISIIGGKLTTYRNLAEQTIDRLGKELHRELPECQTAHLALPGAADIEAARERLSRLSTLSDIGVERLLAIYGGRALAIAAIAAESTLACQLADGRSVIGAEIVFVIREEFPRTLADIVFRRTMLGFDADQGRPLYLAIAQIAAAELGWTEAQQQEQLRDLLQYSDSLLV